MLLRRTLVENSAIIISRTRLLCPPTSPSKLRTSGTISHRNAMSSITEDSAQQSLEYTPERAEELKENLQGVQKEIEEAWNKAGEGSKRASRVPRLVAISKLKPASDIQALYTTASHRHFGENYAQEMVDKAKILPKDIRWHFVGSLQSNKAKLVASVPNLAVIEALGSVKLANALEKALANNEDADSRRGGPLDVFLQVNTSGEEAKSGVKPMTDQDLEAVLSTANNTSDSGSELLELATHILTSCPHLRLRGLMTIGALEASKSSSEQGRNPDFERLCESRRNLLKALEAREDTKGKGLELELELSMGMSADFAAAVGEGSDSVRVGTRIFGERPKKSGA